MHVYILEKIFCVYNILNMIIYMNVNIFKTYAVCVCLYIYTIHVNSTHIYYVKKTFILDAINGLIALS